MGDAAMLLDQNRLPLFSWKSNKQSHFKLKEFRTDHPALGEHYTEELDVRRLLSKVK